MHCPFCRHTDSRVMDSRATDDGSSIRRRRQCPECIVEGDDVAVLRVRRLLYVIETHMNRTATTFLALPVAGELHQDPSHHLRRDSEEVRAIPPFDSIDVDQPQVRLVHQ